MRNTELRVVARNVAQRANHPEETEVRWVVAIVSAVIALVLGSLAGGLATSPLQDQALMDTASAFVGPLAFVYVGAAMAPLRLRGATLFAAIIVVLALLNLALRSTSPTVETLEGQPVSVPIAQIAGAGLAFVLVRARRSSVASEMGWTNEQADAMSAAHSQGGRSAAIAKATEIQAEQVAALKSAGDRPYGCGAGGWKTDRVGPDHPACVSGAGF